MTTSTAPAQPKSYFESDAEVLRPMIASADRVGLAELGQRLVDIRAFMEDDLTTLEKDIGETWTELKTRSDRAARHILSLPGKRIRPLCVLLSARMNGLTMNQAIRSVSLACELVHAATLLHDDVLDQGTERRGLTTARLLFGNSASVLGGDHLLVNALRRVNLSTNAEITQTLLDCIAVMVEAEAIQLDRRGLEPSREVYHEVNTERQPPSLRRMVRAVLAEAPGHIRCDGTVGEKLVWLFRWSTISWISPPMQRPLVRTSGQI